MAKGKIDSNQVLVIGAPSEMEKRGRMGSCFWKFLL